MTAQKTRVVLLFGGRSSEHPVSCATAASVLSAIDRDRYDITPIGITTSGRWVQVPDDPEPLRLTASHTPRVADVGPSVVLTGTAGETRLTAIGADGRADDLGPIDVVFPLLHGPYGEDGSIQGQLELTDVRYVGSGVAASATMMNKHLMKAIFHHADIPLVPHVTITDHLWLRDAQAALAAVEQLGWPVFVKPSRAGSSMGVSKVNAAGDLRAAIEAAREHDPLVIVEAAITGRELECGVLGGFATAGPRSSAVGECAVVGEHDFYDYEAKYLDDDAVVLSAPAHIPDSVSETIRALARRAFDAAGCEGLARCDFFLTQDGAIYLNEVNTMPGFTPTSMFPRLWKASGIGYSDLIDELIELALSRRVGMR